MKIKSAIIAASAAIVIAGSALGFTAYSDENKELSAPVAPMVEQVKAPAVTTPTVEKETYDPELERVEIRELFIKALPEASSETRGDIVLSGEKVYDEEAFTELYAAIDNEEDVREVVKQSHLQLNGRVGFGNHKLLEEDKNKTWDVIDISPFMDERLYLRLAEVMENDAFTEDMKNAAALAIGAKKERNVQAMIYLHRILHDLDYWGLSEDGKGCGDYWGATNYSKERGVGKEKDIVDQIENFIN